MTSHQPSPNPFFLDPAEDARLLPIAEPEMAKDGRAVVAVTMSIETMKAFTALLRGRTEEIDPAELPRLWKLEREMRRAGAEADRLAHGDFGVQGL